MSKELLEYFNGDELAASTCKRKYMQPDEKTPDDIFLRIAREFNAVEQVFQNEEKHKNKDRLSVYGKSRKDLNTESIFNLLDRFKDIIAQGSVMAGAGADTISSLSNCFVIGQPHDSYGGIMQKDEEQVQLMKRRGGVGQDLSSLRPALTPTSNAAKTSTGAVSFMSRYSESTREVAQNGRRGALMLSMADRHPDIFKFVTIKRELTKITGANISVKLFDDFMKAVDNDTDFYLRFPVDFPMEERGFDTLGKEMQLEYGKMEYLKSSEGINLYLTKIKARDLWKEIIKSARDSAEPGLMFWDNMVNYSPDGVYEQFRQVTTNPCSEIAMQPYDACRLMITNLFSFVINPFTPHARFDFDRYKKVNYEAMRLMDDLVTLELRYIDRILDKIDNDPEPEEVKRTERELWLKIKKATASSRRTGLGFTGLGDTLAALGFKYDADESLVKLEEIMVAKMESELDCTMDLAELRGTFAGWDVNKEFTLEEGVIKGKNPFYQFLAEKFPSKVARMVKVGRRNLSWSCLAPTGTTSMMTQTTSGVEPVFMPIYKRRRKVNADEKNAKVDFIDENGDAWEEFVVLHHKFKDYVKVNYPYVNIEDLDAEELKEILEKSPYHGSSANEIDWRKRIEIQSIIQKYTTHSISSTINLPETVTEEEVGEIYMEAWKKGLKGITVYREGSRSGVLVSNDKKEDKDSITKFGEHHAPTRPKYLDAKVVRFNNNKEKWVAFVGLMDGKPYEIFTGLAEDIKIPTKVEEGRISKVRDEDGKKSYNFLYEDEGIIEDIGKVFKEDYWNYGKLISANLRHGMPVHFTVEMIKNLTFEDDHINTWKNGVARALKRFIPDGKAEGMKCRDCDSNNVVFEEGCSICKDCGSSKCG